MKVLHGLLPGLVGFVLALGAGVCAGQGQNQIRGKVGGEALNQSAFALPDIGVQAFNAAGMERDAGRTDGAGGFVLKVPAADPVYRLIVWDEFNRWWGREISDLHNDAKHRDLGMIVLRPQTDGLSKEQKQEESSVLNWLLKHNPLSAALMEMHLGHFDRNGEGNVPGLEGGGAKGSDALQQLWESRYEPSSRAYSKFNYRVLRGADTVPAVSAGKLDFGATDAAPTDAELAASKTKLYKIPVALGGACVVYHSNKLPKELRFTGGLLAKIYLGKVRSWNDAEVAAINPDIALPNLPITVIYSREARAASGVFSRYLSATFPDWREHVPSPETPPLRLEVRPGGENGDMEEEIARKTSATDGAIAYVDSRYGLGSRAGRFELSQGRVLNRAGSYIAPTPDSITASVLEAKGLADLRDSMAKPKSPEAYPMASAFWMVVPVLPEEPKKTFVLLDYINFSLKKGQDSEVASGYVALPPALVTAVNRELNAIAAGLLERVRRPRIM